jgi:predicted transcriptional regulator
MKFEAEVIAEEVLPAIRSILASKLQQEYGFMQKEIAYKLELTQTAVSKYLTGARAEQDVIQKLEDDPQVNILLNDAAGNIAKDEDYKEEIADAIRTIKDKGLLKEKFGDAEKL